MSLTTKGKGSPETLVLGFCDRDKSGRGRRWSTETSSKREDRGRTKGGFNMVYPSFKGVLGRSVRGKWVE